MTYKEYLEGVRKAERFVWLKAAKICSDHAKLCQTDPGKAMLLNELAECFEREADGKPLVIRLNSPARDATKGEAV